MDDDRYATQRARYISRTTDLRKPEARAVAYSERGYSIRGAAKRLDTTESTVQAYLQRAMARYGLGVSETLLPGEEPPELEEVSPEYHRELAGPEKRTWLTYVDRHREKLPQEWVAGVEDSAEGVLRDVLETGN